MSRRTKTLSATKKRLSKTKTSKKAKSSAKDISAPKLYPPWTAKGKGSVTLHLEAQHGKEFTEAELIDGLNEDLRDAWHKLRDFAAGLGPQRIYASKLSIMFARKVCYFYVRPKKSNIEVWLFLPREIEGLANIRGVAKRVRYCNLFKLVHADQVEEPLTDWIREAFDYAPGPERS